MKKNNKNITLGPHKVSGIRYQWESLKAEVASIHFYAVSARNLVSVCYSKVSVIAGCPQDKGWLYNMFMLQITSYKYVFLR